MLITGEVECMLIQNWGWIVSFNIPLLNLQVMEFLLAVNDLIEKKYPPDTVEVALIYNNNEKAKVLKVYSLHSVFYWYYRWTKVLCE